jgi:hypothetical protein
MKHTSGRVSSRPTSNAPERRASQRFPVVCDVRYRVIGLGAFEGFGSGKTVNMSSSGILLAVDDDLSPGSRIEIEMDWPFKREEAVSQKLIIMGQIVRSEKSAVALAGVKISRHTFQTASGRTVASKL